MIGRVGTGFVVAVVVGIVLLTIFIFLAYKASKTESWDCVKCKTEFTTWCSMCFTVNAGKDDWSLGGNLGEDLAKCLNDCGYWPGTATGDDCTNAETACEPFILFTE